MIEVRCSIDDSARPSLDNLRHAHRSMGAQYLVRAGGRGARRLRGELGLPGTTDEPFLLSDSSVVHAHRSRGIGEQLLRRVSARGRELGKEGLQLEVKADDEHSIRFLETRGVASAMKRAQIAGAFERGVKRMVTKSQHENLPTRRLNEKLGYRETVANIVYHGPLLGESPP